MAALAFSRASSRPSWFGVRATAWVSVLAAVLAVATTALFVPVLSQGFVYGILAITLSAVALHRFGRSAAIHLWRRMRVA